MRPQLGRLDLHQIGGDVLNDPLSNCHRQKIDNHIVNRRLGRERPSFPALGLHDLRNSIGQLLPDPAVGLAFERRPIFGEDYVMLTRLHIERQSALRSGDLEILDQAQTRSARGRFRYLICLQAAAIGHDN